MPLRPAQRGYRYQDFVCARIILQQMFEQGNPIIRFDEKESTSDIIDDLKLSYNGSRLCFQIKFTKTSRTLTMQDISNNGELDLSKLYNQFVLENKSVEYYFVLKWGSPIDEDVCRFLERDPNPRFAFANSITYQIISDTYLELKNFIHIPCSNENAKKFFSSLHFVCDAPEASLDFTAPSLLENELAAYATKLGVNQYPNNLTISNFLTQLVDFICNKRSDENFEITQNELLRKLDIRTDYGSIPQSFQIDETIKLLQTEQIEKFHEYSGLHNKIIIEGEPGSGKSYFITEYIAYLNSKNIKFAHHYFFIGNNDDLSVRRINHNTMIGNLIKEVYDTFPDIAKKHHSDFSATITKLNNLLSEIQEPFYLILDGIDHFYRTYLHNSDEDIMNIINSINLHSNVKLILISQPLNNLKDTSFNVYKMVPWSLKTVKVYSEKFGLFLDDITINKAYNLSQGNPLYSAYIFNCLKTGIDSLDSLPTYSTSIETYYSYLFNRINDNELFGIIAVLPFLFTQEDIVEISNRGDFAKIKFNELLPVLNYLPLKGGYCIYHESLKRYIYDHCKKHGIDLVRNKTSIFKWLISKDFYQNEKAYNFALPLALELEAYDWGASLVGFDFLFYSLYYGYTLKKIKSNLEAIKQCICKGNDLKRFATYILVDEIIQQNGDESGNFLTTNVNEYFNAFLSLFKQSGADKLLYRHNLTGDTYNKLIYNAYVNKFINHPLDIIQQGGQHSQYEENTISKIYAAYFVNEGYHLSDVEHITDEDIFYIAYELISKRDIDFIKCYCDDSNNAYSLKRMLNALNCYSFYDISPTYDLNYNYDLSKSDEIAGKVIDFISYSRTKLTKAEIQTIRKKSPNNFIFSFFEYIININDAFKAEDLKERDTLLVKALETFIEICQPFSGSPRSMDLSMPLFRKVFLLQLLSPINYITEIESQLVFIKNILKLYDKIQATITGSQIGCIVLFDIINELPLITNKTNQTDILRIFENRINEEKYSSLYDYISSYYFSLSSIAARINIQKAQELFELGISYALTYGFHKDPFLYDVFDSYEAAEGLMENKETVLKQLGNMAYGMYDHTDCRSTRHLPVTWFKSYLRYSPAGAINYIANAQLKSKVKYWLYDSMIAEAISYIEKDVDCKTLYNIITCYQLEDLDFNIYIRLIDKLIDNSLISLATNLIAYVVGINERSALENETNYNCLNKLSKKINYTLPPFRKVTINHESRKESSYFVPSLEEIIDNPHLAWNLHTDDLIYLVNLMPYEESTKQLIVDIFYEAKSSHYSCEEINKLIDLRIENEEKKVFVYMCVFVIWNDGWLGQFVHIDSAKAAYSINEQKTKEHFFEIAQLLRKHSFFSFHSVGNYLKYLLSINTPSQNILDIWTDVWDFANRRLPDLSEKIQEITKPDNNINDISTQLIIANINNFSEDNYRRAFCYIKKCLDCDVSTVQSIADFVFGNWENINLVAQLSFVYNLCFTNYESLELAEKYKDKILGGKNILISAIGAIVFNEEINTYRTDLSTIKSSNPISDEFLEYSRCFIFNYNIVSSFCQFFKINESNILNYHKDNLKNNYQDFTNEFWSNYYKIFSNNTIAYNSFLEAVDIVLIDSYNNHLVSLNDIYELSSIIADLNQEAFSQPTMPIIKRDDEVLLAEYKLEVIFNYESGAERKVNYNVLGLKLDDKIINIIQNNLQELDQGINYINQIRFYLLDDIVNHLNWSHNIIDGCEVLVDENNNIIARYLTNKYGLLGLESCHDQIYKYQDGKLYITSDAFGKLKTFFDSPNTSLCMENNKTFIFRNKYK